MATAAPSRYQGVTVVMPTYNRWEYLQRCLTSLLELAYPLFEIVVVVDGSTDETNKGLAEISDERLRVIHHDSNRGVSMARNTGVAAAQYNLIAFTDDDCVVDAGWLAELVTGMSDEKIGFVIGRTDYVRDGYHGAFPERVITNQGGRWPGGGSILYRKQCLLETGGFDKNFERYHNEDSELAIRAVSQGWRFSRRPSARVFHQQMMWTVRMLFASGRNAAVWPILKKRYPEHYRAFSSPVTFNFIPYPLDYLLILFSPIFIPLLLIRFIVRGKRSFSLFFTKWPLLLLIRRWWIWVEAVRQRVVMI